MPQGICSPFFSYMHAIQVVVFISVVLDKWLNSYAMIKIMIHDFQWLSHKDRTFILATFSAIFTLLFLVEVMSFCQILSLKPKVPWVTSKFIPFYTGYYENDCLDCSRLLAESAESSGHVCYSNWCCVDISPLFSASCEFSLLRRTLTSSVIPKCVSAPSAEWYQQSLGIHSDYSEVFHHYWQTCEAPSLIREWNFVMALHLICSSPP